MSLRPDVYQRQNMFGLKVYGRFSDIHIRGGDHTVRGSMFDYKGVQGILSIANSASHGTPP